MKILTVTQEVQKLASYSSWCGKTGKASCNEPRLRVIFTSHWYSHVLLQMWQRPFFSPGDFTSLNGRKQMCRNRARVGESTMSRRWPTIMQAGRRPKEEVESKRQKVATGRRNNFLPLWGRWCWANERRRGNLGSWITQVSFFIMKLKFKKLQKVEAKQVSVFRRKKKKANGRVASSTPGPLFTLVNVSLLHVRMKLVAEAVWF